jgi:hypothetical protein
MECSVGGISMNAIGAFDGVTKYRHLTQVADEVEDDASLLSRAAFYVTIEGYSTIKVITEHIVVAIARGEQQQEEEKDEG